MQAAITSHFAAPFEHVVDLNEAARRFRLWDPGDEGGRAHADSRPDAAAAEMPFVHLGRLEIESEGLPRRGGDWVRRRPCRLLERHRAPLRDRCCENRGVASSRLPGTAATRALKRDVLSREYASGELVGARLELLGEPLVMPTGDLEVQKCPDFAR
jgi:hypothetical protein